MTAHEAVFSDHKRNSALLQDLCTQALNEAGVQVPVALVQDDELASDSSATTAPIRGRTTSTSPTTKTPSKTRSRSRSRSRSKSKSPARSETPGLASDQAFAPAPDWWETLCEQAARHEKQSNLQREGAVASSEGEAEADAEALATESLTMEMSDTSSIVDNQTLLTTISVLPPQKDGLYNAEVFAVLATSNLLLPRVDFLQERQTSTLEDSIEETTADEKQAEQVERDEEAAPEPIEDLSFAHVVPKLDLHQVVFVCGRAAALRVRSLDLSGNVVFGLEAEGSELNERLWRHCLLVLRLQRCLVTLTLSNTALGPKVAFQVTHIIFVL